MGFESQIINTPKCTYQISKGSHTCGRSRRWRHRPHIAEISLLEASGSTNAGRELTKAIADNPMNGELRARVADQYLMSRLQ